MNRSAAVLLLLLALLAIGWLVGGALVGGATVAPPKATDIGSRTAATNATGEVGRSSEAAVASADAATANGGERTAAAIGRIELTVRAVWPEGPAVGVRIALRNIDRGGDRQEIGAAVTDARGTVQFSPYRGGRHELLSDRDFRLEIDVVAGAQEVVFELPAGVEVVGTVRDPAGASVPGASIWLQSSRTVWNGGAIVAVADANGDYRLPHMNPKRSLGAVARGRAPSRLVDLDQLETSAAPLRVDLVVGELGGDLVGIVRDADGKPLADADVAVGTVPSHLDWRGREVVEAWTPRTAQSAADGGFAIDGLKTGEVPYAARKPGFGIVRGTVRIEAGTPARLEIVLPKAAMLHGIVTEADGRPAANAIVSVYDRKPGTSFLAGGQIDFDESFGFRRALADADGRYRVDEVTPGEVHAFVQRGDYLLDPRRSREGVSVAFVREVLAVAPGADALWSPQLGDGNVVAGVVLYADGRPMGDVFLTLKDERSGSEAVMTNARDGTFRFLCLADSTYSLRVQYWEAPPGTPTLEQAGIVPNGARLELRAPFAKPEKQVPGTVVGRLDDLGRRVTNAAAVRIELHSDKRWFRTDGKLVDGAFRFGEVEPCRFRIVAKQGETVIASSDWHELAPADTTDVGSIATEPGGALRIAVARAQGGETLEPKLYLRREGDASSTQLDLGRADGVTVENLTPGTYKVSAYGTGACAIEATAEVRAGEVGTLAVTLRPGVLCRFEVWIPETSKATRRSYRFVAENGEVFGATDGEIGSLPTRPMPIAKTLPPGAWTVHVATDDGLRAEAKFVVAVGGDEVKVRLDLQ
ncbi:MAG: hypothetical protein RL398_1721 [Planctomycetota bacterium]